MGNKGFTRRNFLQGSALAALGVSTAGVLGGCGSEAKEATGAASPEATSVSSTESVYAALNPQDLDYRQNSGDLSTVLSEVTIGSITLANRLVKSAAGSDTHKNPEEIIEYHRRFAAGGINLVWMEDCGNTYADFPNQRKAAMEDIPFAQIAEAIHAEGSYIGYQLSCMGTVFSGTPKTASGGFESAVAGDLTMDELKLLQQNTIDAAKQLQAYGFDGVEYNAAGNNLGQSFLSRMRNFREDEYGPQSFENRARFITDIISGIKEACGEDFIVQILINGIEENDDPLGDSSLCTTVEENKELCKMFEAAGADSLHVRLGPIHMHVCQFASDLYFTGYGIAGTTGAGNQFDFSRHWQNLLISDHSGCGMMLDVAAEIKSAVSIPVGTVTYMDPAHAPDYFENALKEEKVDFLLMNRPLTVDSEYLHKLEEERIEEIAPCTRCMHCHFDFDEEGKVYEHCRVNACTQRAYRDQMPEGYELLEKTGDKKVMVIGGGPAGMEAARIAALRGYEVSLYEKNAAVGGLLDFAHAVKGSHENLLDLKNYLGKQLEIAGVSVNTGQEVDADFISQESPDVVILAAGGTRDSLGLSGTSQTNVISIDDFNTAELGDEITIVGSNVQAIDMSMYLLAQGKKVTIVTPDPIEKVAKGHSSWVKTFEMPMIYAQGTRIWPNAKITEVGDGTITISGETGADTVIACSTVIEAMDLLPNTELVDGLSGIETYTIGDCAKPFNIAEAIASGNLTARNI